MLITTKGHVGLAISVLTVTLTFASLSAAAASPSLANPAGMLLHATTMHASGASKGLEFGEPQFLTPLKRSGFGQVLYPAISGDGSVIAFVSDRTDLLEPGRASGDVYIDAAGARTRPYPDSAMTGPRGLLYGASCAQLSRDGRYVMFCSDSPNLVPGDTNQQFDTFVVDRVTGNIDRVNTASDGTQSDQPVRSAAISADGRYVAFASAAADLVAADTNGATDVFVRDREARTTTRVSLGPEGRQGNGDSAYGNSSRVVISGDGRYVGFDSSANNLVPGDTNKIMDVFIRDRTRGTTERVTVDDDGQQMSWNPVFKRSSLAAINSISDNGRHVAFTADGTGIGGIALSNDHNGDQFLRDRTARTTRLVSQRAGTAAGTYPWYAGNGQLTPDGRLLTFRSNSAVLSPFSSNQVLYVYETATGRTFRAPGPVASEGMLTSDGRTMLYIKSDPTGATSVLARRTTK